MLSTSLQDPRLAEIVTKSTTSKQMSYLSGVCVISRIIRTAIVHNHRLILHFSEELFASDCLFDLLHICPRNVGELRTWNMAN